MSEKTLPLIVQSQHNSSYCPPFFADSDRLAKIQMVFPNIDKIYEEYAEKNYFPGYAFGIMVDGQLAHSGSGGYADIKRKIPATTHALFRIASMTKSFTAMAILKLRDEDQLKLDDPAYFYIPELKNQSFSQDAPEVTIRDLLTHSSGFPEDNPWADRNLNIPEHKLIALLKNGISFSNVPGITYEYSNLAFAILGILIRRVSGIPYQEYISENIWKPLHMKQVAWEFTKIPTDEIARGYKWIHNRWEEEELLPDGIFGAMGGMFSSIESLSHYVGLHQTAWPPRNDKEEGPLKRSSLREMHQPWRFSDLNPCFKYLDGQECIMTSAYGYGLNWSKECDSKVYVGHSGGLPGYGSNWLILPEYGIGVFLFANVTYAPTKEINFHVLNTLIREAQLKPRQLSPSPVLKDRQKALLQLLPHWKNAETNHLFADNFFLDTSRELREKETLDLFEKAGEITHISDIIPENQLRGYFMMEGEKTNIKISFTLSPESPALIQSYQIEGIKK